MGSLLKFLAITFVAVVALLLQPIEAFINNGLGVSRTLGTKSCRSSVVLGSGDIFDSFRKLWGGDEEDDKIDADDDDGDEDLPAGTTLLASIPVESIKPGGLRLFLMFYCMGQQNSPDRNTWRADQPSTEEYVVEMLFHDASGILTVELLEKEIRILRSGSTPSTAYIMQESVILQGIVEELRQCAFDESIPLQDRLLIPESDDSLDVLSEELAFG